MRLDQSEARRRLVDSDHGALCTVRPSRGVDAVPAVFAVTGSVANHGLYLSVPVDTIKPKTTKRLQRERNLDADPRAALLVEQWDPLDWSKLWWVRAELRAVPDPEAALVEQLSELLTQRYRQYADQPFRHLLVFEIIQLSGWRADQSSLA